MDFIENKLKTNGYTLQDYRDRDGNDILVYKNKLLTPYNL